MKKAKNSPSRIRLSHRISIIANASKMRWVNFIAVLLTADSKAEEFAFPGCDFCSTFIKKWKKENPCYLIARA
jgi:hypothetical protein